MTTASNGAQAAISAWFATRLPPEWVTTPAKVTVDREEIVVLLTLPEPPSDEPSSD